MTGRRDFCPGPRCGCSKEAGPSGAAGKGTGTKGHGKVMAALAQARVRPSLSGVYQQRSGIACQMQEHLENRQMATWLCAPTHSPVAIVGKWAFP